jgi:hypothetical protein
MIDEMNEAQPEPTWISPFVIGGIHFSVNLEHQFSIPGSISAQGLARLSFKRVLLFKLVILLVGWGEPPDFFVLRFRCILKDVFEHHRAAVDVDLCCQLFPERWKR